MKKIIFALVLVAVLSVSLIACGQKEPVEANTSKSETTTSATELATNETTEFTTELTTNEPELIKDYLAPKNFIIKGGDKFCKIKWHDDNSLEIEDSYDCEIYACYDVKINEYGEVLSIKKKSYTEDENGKRIEESGDYCLVPKYDAKHRLVSVSDKDIETNTITSTANYHYNDEGLRVKTTILGHEGEYDTLFEYKNGKLVKSTHKKFEPTGEDRIYSYKYDTNRKGLITNSYCNISIPGVNRDDDWEREQSFEYENVTKAQHDFFYNTLIYHIIDSNEGIL